MLNSSIQQACMDTTDWLKGIVQEGSTMMDSSSSSPSTELISCPSHPPPTVLERRLRPPQDHALKCPRCDSTQTKFCYYNNYSLSQPRYFCKTCRRYWTKGGSLRNVPVGGGCRKNKRSGGGKKPAMADHTALHQFHPFCASAFADRTGTDLQLSSFSGLLPPPMSHLGTSLPGGDHRDLSSFMECKHDVVGAFDTHNYHSDDKFGTGITGNPIRNQLFSCIAGVGGGTGGGLGNASCYGDISPTNITPFHGGMSPLGFSMDGSNGALMTPLPFDAPNNDTAGDGGVSEAKLSGKLLSLEWQEQGCSSVDRPEAFGYATTTSGVGMWAGAHHGTSSTSSPLV